jgi:peptidoglycan/xylan/chitin deacetylase (PgdA/CDA1 family)
VDPRDWATKDPHAIERSVLKNIKDGDIVLLHDMTASSVQAALAIIDTLLEENYEVITVSELARIRNLRPKPGQVYTCFPAKEENLK